MPSAPGAPGADGGRIGAVMEKTHTPAAVDDRYKVLAAICVSAIIIPWYSPARRYPRRRSGATWAAISPPWAGSSTPMPSPSAAASWRRARSATRLAASVASWRGSGHSSSRPADRPEPQPAPAQSAARRRRPGRRAGADLGDLAAGAGVRGRATHAGVQFPGDRVRRRPCVRTDGVRVPDRAPGLARAVLRHRADRGLDPAAGDARIGNRGP